VEQNDRGDSVGRAVARYTALRFLLFVAAFLLVRVFIEEPVLALGAAVILSAIVSIPLLAPYRHRLNAATAARAERRRAAAETTSED
jgi:hypothetical protein